MAVIQDAGDEVQLHYGGYTVTRGHYLTMNFTSTFLRVSISFCLIILLTMRYTYNRVPWGLHVQEADLVFLGPRSRTTLIVANLKFASF